LVTVTEAVAVAWDEPGTLTGHVMVYVVGSLGTETLLTVLVNTVEELEKFGWLPFHGLPATGDDVAVHAAPVKYAFSAALIEYVSETGLLPVTLAGVAINVMCAAF
jgi:hypothetical protein